MAGHRGRKGFQYKEFDSCAEPSIQTTGTVPTPVARHSITSHSTQADEQYYDSRLPWSPRSHSQSNPYHDWYRLSVQDPDHLFLSVNVNEPTITPDDDLQRSNVKMPPPLPDWLWIILVYILGIKQESTRLTEVAKQLTSQDAKLIPLIYRANSNVVPRIVKQRNAFCQKRYFISTYIYVATLLSASLFGMSGLFFNIYDTISEYTKTTILMSIAKSIIGLYWIGLGIYANSLAARLFSNKRMVDCIRLHSKTFLKISTAVIVLILAVAAVVTNLYSTHYMLLSEHDIGSGTLVENATCNNIGVDVKLCQIFFTSKVIYSGFSLTWNLLVVGIFLSVCRTHTISIRRFMKELMYDTKIYEEFRKLQALQAQMQRKHQQPPQLEPQTSVIDQMTPRGTEDEYHFRSDSNIWDDDITGFDHDNDTKMEAPSNAPLLRTLRFMRQNTRERFYSESGTSAHELSMMDSIQEREGDERPTFAMGEESESSVEIEAAPSQMAGKDSQTHSGTQPSKLSPIQSVSSKAENKNEIKPESPPVATRPHDVDRQYSTDSILLGRRPPIMRNEDLMFTYYQLLRRLSSTSRLLQRWISSWITFVMLWCALMIIYWTSHVVQLMDIVQFLIPLIALGLLTSAYAEVNFEGERLLKCVLPTEERMPVIYYFQNNKMEVKIFSFTMTYNTIVTVVAGVAITFATRIILDQIA